MLLAQVGLKLHEITRSDIYSDDYVSVVAMGR